MREPVLFEELPTESGHRVVVATLNAPASLNALSLEMVRALAPALKRLARDERVAAILLRGSGTKAFCAGGNLRRLYESLQAGPIPSDYAADFFSELYELNYLLHGFPKPVVCWGHGIVMGGGLGLLAAASHRVVTEASMLAMPEIRIGLYPDVGGSWMLRRMPGRVGLFVALTAARLNAADALFCGIADWCCPAYRQLYWLTSLRDAHFSDDPKANRALVSRSLEAIAIEPPEPSKVRAHFDRIQALMAGEDLGDIARRLRHTDADDPWLHAAGEAFRTGSPTSAALAFELWQRAHRLSLADTLRLEYEVSLRCCARQDFLEGIRARLIDKDDEPRWSPRSLREVTPQLVASHFQARISDGDPLEEPLWRHANRTEQPQTPIGVQSGHGSN